jgi:hypothetical protein
MRPVNLPKYQGNSPRSGICSGGCPFFEPEYSDGRKIPGTGSCMKGPEPIGVSVGTPCLWRSSTRPALVGAGGQVRF